MELKKTSDYAKYLVLSDRSESKLHGTYQNFLEFKKIKDVVNNIAFSDKSTYSVEGNIYKRKITSTEAKNILTNINDCKWSDATAKMLLIASQLLVKI